MDLRLLSAAVIFCCTLWSYKNGSLFQRIIAIYSLPYNAHKIMSFWLGLIDAIQIGCQAAEIAKQNKMATLAL